MDQYRFQYVSCQFDSLRDHNGAARIRKALEDLPIGLDETYERILKVHINSTSLVLARNMGQLAALRYINCCFA